MRSLHDRATSEGQTGVACSGGALPVSFAPTAGQEPAAETRAVQALVQALNKAVQARRLYATAAPPIAFLAQLEAALAAYLAENHFLRLQVTARGFVFRGVEVLRDERRDAGLPALLAGDGVVELLFKEGVTRDELERCVEALHFPPGPADPTQGVATLLWEADLRRIVFRCSDEFLHARPGEPHPLDLINEPVGDGAPPENAALDGLLEGEAALVGAESAKGEAWGATAGAGGAELDGGPTARFSAASEQDEFVELDADRLPHELWSALQMTPADLAARRALRLPSLDEMLPHLGRQLVSILAAEPDVDLRAAALDLLGNFVDALLKQRRLEVVRDVLLYLQQTPAAGGPAEARVVERLCDERNVLVLGAALDAAGGDTAQAAPVRDILAALRERAVEPLCTLLGGLENMLARKLVCHVLAVAAGGDPSVLAQHAEGQPWYVARNMTYVLGRIGGAPVLPHLKRWARHAEPRVRIEVARALGRVRQPASVALLCDLLDDGEPRVRRSAVWSLATLGDARVLPRLRQLLFEERGFRARRSEERDDFFRTYGRLADDAAFAELARLLGQRQWVGMGWQVELRRGAALALGEMNRSEATRILRAQTRARDTRLREACQAALRAQRNRGAGAALEPPDRWQPAPEDAPPPAGAQEHISLEVADED